MRTIGRLVAALAAVLFPGCNADEGGEGALQAEYGLAFPGDPWGPLQDDPVRICCEDEVVAMLGVGGVAVIDGDGAPIPGANDFRSQFDDPPVAGTRYLGFSLADVDPPGALAFRWDGPFVADLHRDQNEDRDLMPFDPEVDVGEPLPLSVESFDTLEVSAARCDFEQASFTMIVFEFSYLANPTQGAGIAVYRTVERAVTIVNTCYVPPPPPVQDMIVFSNKPGAGQDAEIWVIDDAGGNGRQLTQNAREDWDPAWSPDRTQIAFVSNSQGDGTHLDLMVMDFDATSPAPPPVTPLTAFTGQLSARDPAWSPLGRKVACAAGNAGFFDRILIFDLALPAGTPPVEVSTLPLREIEHLSWHADGRIAFCNAGAAYVLPADFATAPTMIGQGLGLDWSLDWGPVGLVLHRYTSIGQFRIVRTDSAGGGTANVTVGGSHLSDLTPSWSPISDRIVFVRQQDEESAPRLWIVGANGTNAAEMPNQPTGSNSEPDWGFGPLP